MGPRATEGCVCEEGQCVIPALCQCEEEDGTLREGEGKVLEAESCCPVCHREYPEDPVAECLLTLRSGTSPRATVAWTTWGSASAEGAVCPGPMSVWRSRIFRCSLTAAAKAGPAEPVLFLSLQCASGDVEPVVHSCECTAARVGNARGNSLKHRSVSLTSGDESPLRFVWKD
ncbi:SCO-spondin-like [Cyprinus carpio]|uniref:SCO-spondin-like n=1 Tax=Cyprinus carpio TaxID=7962 RepID=A0A9Q9VTG7_CYPCA|nr:SCO-spondin-like [Cyprinus carpio]